ncbi:transcriptional regulation of mitochondrial recombination-domain-containing protein [Chaetomium tenue]|uniref:Transcriptional regulation of mitochondrial recombination-domain-containing protein n=1 Tax=Chaetomium tenue TaxID=1854479 RepID=A0ACB7PCV0_9PEZI|nr:transcriptional regulation of mitochondrial recombination-domain-containing protein [Chaetomium globosum]
MNTLRPLPLLSSRLLFSNGARTTTIGVRYASTEAATATATTTAPTEAASVPAIQGESNSKKPGGHRPRSIPPPGHAERIWVHNHFLANHIIYSFTPEMNPTKAFRQFAYTGKKLVPAKLRKDYWRPMAVVEFGAGRGDVGRSVFHKLRELKKRHQLEWDDPAILQMDRRARGRALNDERGNAVADIAAVLGGRGKGNRVVVGGGGGGGGVKGGEGKALVVGGSAAAEGGNAADAKEKREKELAGLQSATVYWANEQDKYYAEEWTANVTHVVGLPEKGTKKTEEAVVEEKEAAETEAAAETPKAE